MCACRCGIRVHVRDNQVTDIEGNPDHPLNKGSLCAKGAAGLMHQASPARLTKSLKRVGQRGRAEFVAIEWDEALANGSPSSASKIPKSSPSSPAATKPKR